MKCAQKRTNVSYGNPIIAEIETQKTFNRHRQQLKNIRPSIDCAAPKRQPHLQLYGRDYYARKKAVTEAAFADLKMIQSIAKTMTRPYVVPCTKGPVSLNSNYRKKELFRITSENHQLLDRLETLQPVISTKKMDDDHKNNQLYMVNASYSARKVGNYDRLLNRPGGSKKSMSMTMGGNSVQSAPALPNLPESQNHSVQEKTSHSLQEPAKNSPGRAGPSGSHSAKNSPAKNDNNDADNNGHVKGDDDDYGDDFEKEE